MTWLITGGAGYIGGHLASEMVKNDYSIAILDDLSSGKASRIPYGVPFLNASILDESKVSSFIQSQKISGVIHLAAKKNVSESFQESDQYFRVNTEGTKVLSRILAKNNINKFIFSSTAAVYKGQSNLQLISETSDLSPSSPYGESKLAAEVILQNFTTIKSIIFRYFNVVGALNSELEDNRSENLLAQIERAVQGKKNLTIFGRNYPTPDGTCIRDYIHVQDLVGAHLLAISQFENLSCTFPLILNLGTGRGYSVLEVVDQIEQYSGRKIDFEFDQQRSGDVAASVCDPVKAKEILGWTATLSPFAGFSNNS